MKLNLKSGTNIKNGYINIDLLDIQNVPKEIYKLGSYFDLSWLCEDEQVEEIISNNAISFCNLSEVDNTINHWKTKLKNNGILSMFINDIDILFSVYLNNSVTLETINNGIFFGGNAQNVMSKQYITNILSKNNFTIEKLYYQGATLFIEATKNDS